MPWTELGNERGGRTKTQRHLPPEALPSELDVVLQLAELVRLDRLVPRHDHLPHELPAKPCSIRTCSDAQGMWVRGRRTWRNFPSCNPAVDRGRSAHRRLSRTYTPKCSYLLASHRVSCRPRAGPALLLLFLPVRQRVENETESALVRKEEVVERPTLARRWQRWS